MAEKTAYCLFPLLAGEMLLCALSVFFEGSPAAGLLAGHVMLAGLCMFFLRRDEGMRREGIWGGHIAMTDVPEADAPGADTAFDACGKPGTIAGAVLWAAASCALCLLCTYLLNVTGLAGMDASFARADAVIKEAPEAVRFIIVIIAAPFSEELLYRGVLYRRTAACFGERTGFLASVAAFALSHANLTQGLCALASGTLFMAACRREGVDDRRCLWLPVFLHSVFNACSMFVVPVVF